VSGIGYICFAIFLLIKLSFNWTNNQFFDIAGFLVVLLFFGLIIYGFVLGLQQAARRRDLCNLEKTNRKIPSEPPWQGFSKVEGEKEESIL
jgi:cytosine/uracil/thiamine/allantoin permease